MQLENGRAVRKSVCISQAALGLLQGLLSLILLRTVHRLLDPCIAGVTGAMNFTASLMLINVYTVHVITTRRREVMSLLAFGAAVNFIAVALMLITVEKSYGSGFNEKMVTLTSNLEDYPHRIFIYSSVVLTCLLAVSLTTYFLIDVSEVDGIEFGTSRVDHKIKQQEVTRGSRNEKSAPNQEEKGAAQQDKLDVDFSAFGIDGTTFDEPTPTQMANSQIMPSISHASMLKDLIGDPSRRSISSKNLEYCEERKVENITTQTSHDLHRGTKLRRTSNVTYITSTPRTSVSVPARSNLRRSSVEQTLTDLPEMHLKPPSSSTVQITFQPIVNFKKNQHQAANLPRRLNILAE